MTDTNGRPSVDAAAERDTAESPAQGAEQKTIDSADYAAVAAEYKDKLLRVLAEMENLRRRTEREIADTRVYGISAGEGRRRHQGAARRRRVDRARALESAGEARSQEVRAVG